MKANKTDYLALRTIARFLGEGYWVTWSRRGRAPLVAMAPVVLDYDPEDLYTSDEV
jgi:hypothetical protein